MERRLFFGVLAILGLVNQRLGSISNASLMHVTRMELIRYISLKDLAGIAKMQQRCTKS
jgi:hypothetical protein